MFAPQFIISSEKISPRTFMFTSEQVTSGHPDKLADQVSDAIVDAYLAVDNDAKLAVECAVKNNTVILLGEVTSKHMLHQEDYEKIVRNTIKNIGYDDAEHSIDYRTCKVVNLLDRQSPDIAQAVHVHKSAEDIAAGDQGLMSMYATNETKSMMPASYAIATELAHELQLERESGKLSFLRPDGKTQITMEYYEDQEGKLFPIRIDTLILSTQHSEDIDNETLRKRIFWELVLPTIHKFEAEEMINFHQNKSYENFNYQEYYHSLPETLQNIVYQFDKETYDSKIATQSHLIKPDTKILINPSGRFVIGGPTSDSGLTGRKIVCDACGGWSAVGGGAYSGKNYEKVDRSASYMCRHICKSIIASGYANRVSVQLGYAIGLPDPVSIYVDCYGFYDNRVPRGAAKITSEQELVELIKKTFGLRPGQICKAFDMKRPIYEKLAAYGHFGRKDIKLEDCLWESIKYF